MLQRSRITQRVFRLFSGLIALIAVALIALYLTPTPAFAAGGVTGSIRGHVVEPGANAPVAGAMVTATSASGAYKVTTDGSGRFTFLNLPTDTYVVSVEKPGYESQAITGVTILGDATVDLAQIRIGKSLRTIGHVTSRAPTSAFQPSQTQDTYTVSGQRITQALGNSYSTNESTLLQSVPGVIPTFDTMNGTALSVRGSLAVELGYQLDGIPFTEPFFAGNGSQGYLNNISGGTGGSLQVVSGAGDATQGNSGGGTINTVIPRGAYPGEATLDLEVAGPWYNHTLNFNDSMASKNGRISNYFAYSGSRYAPQYAPYGASSLDSSPDSSLGGLTQNTGQYYSTGYVAHDDLLDNFVVRFGNGGNQSLQILDRVANLSYFAGYGGLYGLQYYNSPNLPTPATSFFGQFSGAFPGTTIAQQNQYLGALVPSIPYAPPPGSPVTAPDQTFASPLHFLKVGYTNNLNQSTFLSLAYYNWGLTNGGTNYAYNPNTGPANTVYGPTGGTRTGGILSLTKAFGNNQTVTLEGKYEDARPFWDGRDPAVGLEILEGSFGFTPPSTQPQVYDWYLPPHLGQPVSANNACPSPNNPDNPSPVAPAPPGQGCYIYSALLAAGKWNGTLPQIPNMGFNYHGTIQQQWGLGFRDQYAPTSRLHFDFGVRIDGENNLFGQDQLGAATPSDVKPTLVGNNFLRPREIEPRAAVSYQVGTNDSVRFSYGRSTLFFFGQTLGTPFNLTGINPLLYDIPAKDTATDPGCGSGTHGPGPGYAQSPNNYQNGANFGSPAYFFKCPNYAVSVASLYDQLYDAPDLGGFGPPTYSNFDFSYSHQFSRGFIRGWATHTTAYTRIGYNVEQNVLLLNGPPNPVTGQSSASIFTTLANGSERTFGIEQQLTTPEIPAGRAGASGYVTFDYISQFTNTPPVAGSSSLPILGQQLFQTGTFFRSGFVPPVTFSSGATYQFKNGLRITPSLLANTGYAFGVGRTSIGYVNGVLMSLPETNYGVNTPFAGTSGPGFGYNASYFVDPQVPGSSLKPNIIASRGYNEPALAGNGRTPPQAYLNLTVEYPFSKNATFGVEVFNLTNNVYTVPQVNTLYQPVGFGVAGPQTGKLAASLPTSSSYIIGTGDESYRAGATLPFLNGLGPGTNVNAYVRLRL